MLSGVKGAKPVVVRPPPAPARISRRQQQASPTRPHLTRSYARPFGHVLLIVLLVGISPIGAPLRAMTQSESVSETAVEAASMDVVSDVSDGVMSLDPPEHTPVRPEPAARPPRSGLQLGSYVVDTGDSLSRLAQRHGVKLDTLVWANDLVDPDFLRAGTELVIPPVDGVLHRVRPGDTLADLAALYSSDLRKTIAVNALEPPFIIIVGQRVLLPDGKMPVLARPVGEGEARSTEAAGGRVPAPKPLPSPPGASPEQAQFILTAADVARASLRASGVPASVTIAQAILESFWGTSRLSRENHNYFGIKGRERPGSAGVVWFDVWEVFAGRNVTSREPFRAYDSMRDSFLDHGQFFHQNSRYAGALLVRDDPKQFAREIGRAGYATDPAYSNKLIALMDRFNLYAYDEL